MTRNLKYLSALAQLKILFIIDRKTKKISHSCIRGFLIQIKGKSFQLAVISRLSVSRLSRLTAKPCGLMLIWLAKFISEMRSSSAGENFSQASTRTFVWLETFLPLPTPYHRCKSRKRCVQSNPAILLV